MNNVQTTETHLIVSKITANLTDLKRVLKEVKKQEEKGTLPADGKITTLTHEQAQAMLQQLNSLGKIDCSDRGRSRYIIHQIYQGASGELKKELITQVFNEKALRPHVPSLMNALSPEELKDWAIRELASKALPHYKFIESTQKLLETYTQAVEDHASRCSRLIGTEELIKQGTQEAIGLITYKTPTPSSSSLPPPVAPKPLSMPQTTYEKISYKLPKQPDIKTIPLPPLKSDQESEKGRFQKNSSQTTTSTTTSSSWIDRIQGNMDISVSPLKPKHMDVSANATLDNMSIGAGMEISLTKPLSSRFVIHLPVTASPIPLCVNVNGQLNELHKMQFKLEVPLNPVDKLVSVIGIKCPPSLRIVSLKVENVVKSIKKVFGKKKRRKHREVADESAIVKHKISYINHPISPELEAACKKIADHLMQMETATQKLAHEMTIAIEGTKNLKEELEELYTRQAALQKDFDKVQATFDAQKELLTSLPSIQAQVIDNQQQLSHLTSIVQANITPDRLPQLRDKFSAEEKAKLLAQTIAISNLQF